MTAARMLQPKVVEKVWGRSDIGPPFVVPSSEPVGEIWFEPPPEMPELLVKYLFTSENLSVQVHPSDLEAPSGHRGKEECWLVLSAEPGAQLAVGFRSNVASDTMHAAAIDGTIEDLLAWRPVVPGDFVYLPAGTVHAIGSGLTLIEVQQNSDVTYRLYDYGRPRELHVQAAVGVAHGMVHPDELRRSLPERGHVQLVDGPHFRLERIDGAADADMLARFGDRPLLLIPLAGEAAIGETTVGPGSCSLVRSLASVELASAGQALVAQPA